MSRFTLLNIFCIYLIRGRPQFPIILGYFGKRMKTCQKNYKEFVSILIDKECESPLKNVISSTILGTQDFVSFIKNRYISPKKDDKDLPALKDLSDKPTVEGIIVQVDKVIKDNEKFSRNIKIYLCWKYTGSRLDDISSYFGIGGSGVCQAGRRISKSIKKDCLLARIVNRIEKKLSIMKV